MFFVEWTVDISGMGPIPERPVGDQNAFGLTRRTAGEPPGLN